VNLCGPDTTRQPLKLEGEAQARDPKQVIGVGGVYRAAASSGDSDKAWHCRQGSSAASGDRAWRGPNLA
jgi:hypothetical protein